MVEKTKRTIKGRNGGTLTPFEKGKVSNPKGRPKGATNFRTELQKILDSEVLIDGQKMEGRAALCAKLFKKALEEEDLKAIAEIMDRTDGKAIQATVNINEDVRVVDHDLLKSVGLECRE